MEVDYEPLAPVTDARAALVPGAPEVWEGGNLALQAENGDEDAVAGAFQEAAHVVSLDSWNQRISGVPMEPRAAVSEFDAASGCFTLHAPSQGVHRHQGAFMQAFGIEADKVRIITGAVGGGFGVRTPCYGEYVLIAWASRRLGRPVKWLSGREEFFQSDFQARDVFVTGIMGLDGDGHILGVELDYTGNLGAYPASFSVYANVLRMAGGTYDIPAAHILVRAVFTNTVPMTVLRGAGRPESTFIIERLLDLAALEMGLDRTELRRRNLVAPEDLPYQSALGHLHDSGRFADNMASLMEMLGWAGFEDRRAAAAARGRLAGIGLANYLESPTGAHFERGDITIGQDGLVDAVIGTGDSGQGHATIFAQVLAHKLELPFETLRVRFGDTDFVVSGGGTHSDRSLRLGGTALVRAADKIILEGKRLASEILEAGEGDIIYGGGRFAIEGTDRSIGLFELARERARPFQASDEIGARLHAYPNGVGGCELEVDPETGAVEILSYCSVDDVGRVINPMIVAGQVHGGIALGLGQALSEQIVHDANGQILTGTFMDYAMPRAGDIPHLRTATNEQPAPSNPLGVKGAGECGTTPSSAAVISALADALGGMGIHHLEMPATPERIWRAIRDAGGVRH